MVKEAELHAEEDKKERERAEIRNDADNMIYSTEKNIKDLGDKVNAADKSKAEEAIADLRKAVEAGDIEAVKTKTEALKQVSYKIAEEVYKQTGSQPGAQGGAAGAQAPGGESSSGAEGTKNAEDADYEVVDDNK
jgi:molecular chaperone DnaK